MPWEERLTRYHELAVQELVRFDPEEPPGARLRAWDRVSEDLVERQIAEERTPCLLLGLNWIILPVEGLPTGLRLVDDDGRLLESPDEAAAHGRTEAEAARYLAEEARARAEDAAGRARAEARIRELEAELAKRSRG